MAMLLHRTSSSVLSIAVRCPRIPGGRRIPSSCRSYTSNSSRAPRGRPSPLPSRGQSSPGWLRNSLGLLGTATVVFLGYTYATAPSGSIEKREGSDGKGFYKFENEADILYTRQKKSLECPGVYLWGANSYRVADPGSNDPVVKTPRRLSHFDGQVLRDLKIDEKSGAAITEEGNLVQWGRGFSDSSFKPTTTLSGKNLTSLCMSRDRIIALASNGKVYSLPISKEEQESGHKGRESSWIPFWSGTASINYRVLQPRLRMTEKVVAIGGGLNHILLLTNSGRLFSAASSTEQYPALGQLGIPQLSWESRPKGPVDTCHEILTLKGSKVVQIAAGDYHSLALTDDGRIFSFGDNSFGQLGIELESQFIDTPTPLPLDRIYRENTWSAKATGVAAGGANSFFTVDTLRTLEQGKDLVRSSNTGRITTDTWACGRGIWGTLGNGKWTHLQDSPTKVKLLSGLFEYDESVKSIIPIRLRKISVGATHASAVMDNLDASDDTESSKTSGNGHDVLWWGGNEYFQLGTGKRSNISKPTYIRIHPGTGGGEQGARLQIESQHRCKVGNRTVDVEQRVECGRYVSAIYSAT